MKNKFTLVNNLKKISDFFNRIATWISLLYVSMVTILVLVGVIFRMFGNSLSWSEELARWFIIGTAFIAASVALKEGKHVGVTIIVKSFPDWLKKATILLGDILILIFLSYTFWYGIKAAIGAINQTGAIVMVSMVYVKMNVPIGAALMIIHMVYYIAGIFAYDNPEQFLLTATVTSEEVE